MILIGLGSNVSGPWGSPRETVMHALRELDRGGTKLVIGSALVETSPFGKVNQPSFVNAVARITTAMPPDALMLHLHEIERQAGRRRRMRWGPRTLDLDLLDYHGLIRRDQLKLPHPGIAERDFVLAPLTDSRAAARYFTTRQPTRCPRGFVARGVEV